MPVPNPTPLAENRAAAKRQAVTTVSIVALILILWPERFIILRNLCLVPVLAWVTALVFDLKHGALDAWDGVPAWLKRIIGADDNSNNNYSNASRRNEPLHMRNRQDASPKTMSGYVLTHLGDSVSLITSEAVRLWELARPILEEWARQAIQWLSAQASASQSSSSASSQKPAPKFTQYYGILVKAPRAPDVPPVFAPLFQLGDVPGSFNSRDSKQSVVPSVLSSWDAESRLSLVLVEKTVWDDGHLTLRRKLSTGTNWSLSPPGRGEFDKQTQKPDFGQISGIDVIGLGTGEYDALNKCRRCFQLVSQNWKYTRMLWDDVDFAVVLSLLVLGPAAATRCVELYRSLCKLREKHAGAATRGAAGLSPLLVAAATGGLAAPFALPLMAAAAAAAAMKKGGKNSQPEQRKKAYRSLMVQFPELKVLFEEEEMEQREEEEWKDVEEDYYNEAFSPFDW
ncbi:hypothetical protein BBK36DRAFT_1164864 [Trichoderma citrinoviride]|uniref:Uncharacterized protein n=1 Tax=Trichoderma citrinoviride TaxID=58853 RepID=A0A2T4BLX7_9HYPO|nr:hypothetical protein BBK36DRAFT_1164864 [Trichoderma citrinoviride]PTB70316.1 hypothetical protein BBK36DRAFT_1164864 [Trichoderma citrinoviride]